MSVIQTADLTKTYGDVTALDGLSLTIDGGELFGFLGPNGAGKTTTINILTGQLTPDAGTATVLGADPTTNPVTVREQIGILPEKESPPDHLTPREYFDLVGTIRSLDTETVTARVEEWATRLAYREHLDTISTDLSRGQQQKVMITQAFLHEPAVVIIDEPLANLDPMMQEQVRDYFTEYVANGNTIFLSTHHIEVAEAICTRVGFLQDGQLVADRDPRTLDGENALLDTFLADTSGYSTDPVDSERTGDTPGVKS